jgi:hypothetical protein
VAPGVFFYWMTLSGLNASTTYTFEVDQSTTYNPTTGTPFFTTAAGSFAYDGNCNTLSTTLGGSSQGTTVTFTTTAAGTYFIGLKYSPKPVVGSSPAKTTAPGYVYTFSTKENSPTPGPVNNSTSTIQLNHQ